MSERGKSYPTQALVVSEADMSVYQTELSAAQVNFLLQRTPKEEIKTRPGKGGGTWSYVEVGYVIDMLNKVFGFLWDFDVVDRWRDGDEVIVEGKLTVTTPKGDKVSKKQFGGAEVKYRRDGNKVPLSLVNDYKAAASDALKKCASLLGIALDLYGRERLDEEPEDLGGGWVRAERGERGERVPVTQDAVHPSKQTYYANKPKPKLEELFDEAEEAELSQRNPGSKFDLFGKWATKKLKTIGCADPLINSIIQAALLEGDRLGTLDDTKWLHDMTAELQELNTSGEAAKHLGVIQGRNYAATQSLNEQGAEV